VDSILGTTRDVIDRCSIVQKRVPAYRFRLSSVVDAHNDRVRFTWEAGGTDDAPMHFVGTDFGVVAKHARFESVTGFVEVGPSKLPGRNP
jgi:hypothetical protein